MRIARKVLEDVTAHARRASPAECCGILLATGDARTAARAIRCENVERDRPDSRYVLDHRHHIRAVEMEISGAGTILGYYHSHPRGSAVPSPRDGELAARETGYLIIGMAGEKIEYAAWRFERGGPVREPLEVIEDGHDPSK